MKISPPPSPTSVQALNEPHRISADTTPSRESSLKSRTTDRSHDYLLRLTNHGNLHEKQMASSARIALEHGTFIHNPAVSEPVHQYGIASEVEDRKGVLLANFIAHGEQLELAALGFRESRYFGGEAGPVKVVALDHAKVLPESKPLVPAGATPFLEDPVTAPETKLRKSASTPLLAKKKATGLSDISTQSEPAKTFEKDIKRARRDLKWMALKNQLTPMHFQMASVLAASRVKQAEEEGRHMNSWAALPAAHLDILKAKVKKPRKSSALETAPYTPPPPVQKREIPNLLPYQFPKETFAVFHEDFLLQESDIKAPSLPKVRPKGGIVDQQTVRKLTKRLAAHPSRTSEPDAGPTYSQFIGSMPVSLRAAIDAAEKERPKGRIMDQQDVKKLNELLAEQPSRISKLDVGPTYSQHIASMPRNLRNAIDALDSDTDDERAEVSPSNGLSSELNTAAMDPSRCLSDR